MNSCHEEGVRDRNRAGSCRFAKPLIPDSPP
eukprot:gene26759-biopygen17304